MDLQALKISANLSASQVMMWSKITGPPVRSGQRAGKTKISKQGNSKIRRILFLPAFNAVRFAEPACEALFERVFEKTQIKMKAYVAVQKKLLTLCFAIWKNGAKYDPLYYANNVKELKGKDKKIVPTSGTTQDAMV